MEFFPEIALSLLATATLIVAERIGGSRLLWPVATGGAAVLGFVLWRRWEMTPGREAPLIAHVLAAIVPMYCVALLLWQSRGWNALLQMGLGAALYFILYFASALLGMYVLGDVIPLSR